MTEDRREKLKRLIIDAEHLMNQARRESREIVESAEQRAKALVRAATDLHRTAEAEAAQLRESADRYRAETEADARALIDEAQASHRNAIEAARRVREDFVAGGDEPAPEADRSDALVAEAAEKADRILRVARSEASARSEELLEQTRRRITQMEDDARRRIEVAAAQHREMQRSMRNEQLELKSRIAELDEELRNLEHRRERIAPETVAPEAPVEEDTESPEAAAAPAPEMQRADGGVQERVDRNREIPSPPVPASDGTGDPDFDKAIRRFRRRA